MTECLAVRTTITDRFVVPTSILSKPHGVPTYQIALPIASINQIPCICLTVIRKSVVSPLCLVGSIRRHGTLQLINVDAIAVDTIAGPEDIVDVFYQSVESIERYGRGSCGVVQCLRLRINQGVADVVCHYFAALGSVLSDGVEMMFR